MANVLRNLRIREVSGVDKGAGEGVQILLAKRADDPFDDTEYETLCKRSFSAEQRRDAASSGAAMPGGRYPIENKDDLQNAIHAIGRGKGSHADIKAHIISRAKSLGASDMLPDDWKVGKLSKALDWLLESVVSIVKDDRANDKEILLKQTINEFAEEINGPRDTDTSKSLNDAGTSGATDNGEIMSEALKKALGLTAEATEADVLAAITKRDEDLAKAQHEINVSKMSDPHKAFMDKGKMPKGGKEAFAAMSADERNANIKDNPMNDNDGDEATKRLAEELKKRDDEVAELRKRVDERDEADRVATFAKRATDLGFKAEFGATIRKAYSGDAAAQAEVEKEIASLRKQVEKGALFAEFGSNVAKAGSALSEAQAKAEELRKSDSKLTAEKALAKVYETNPEILKRVRAESRAH